MQPSDLDLATIVKEDDYARGSRMNCSVIRRGNIVFMTITRANSERLKRRSVQKLPYSRNHDETLIPTLRLINSPSIPSTER